MPRLIEPAADLPPSLTILVTPWPVLTGVAAAVVVIVAGVDNAVLLVATYVALFTVALQTTRKVAWIAGELAEIPISST